MSRRSSDTCLPEYCSDRMAWASYGTWRWWRGSRRSASSSSSSRLGWSSLSRVPAGWARPSGSRDPSGSAAVRRWRRDWATRRKELFLLAILLLVLGTALATSRAGLTLAVGAFLAGLVVSDSDFGHQAMADVAPFRDAFNALFFVSVGMLFDGRILLARPG